MTDIPTPSPPLEFDHEKIRNMRQDADMSMVQLGIALWKVGAVVGPATRQQISNWETGHCRPTSATLRGLAEIFGVPMESFFKKAEE